MMGKKEIKKPMYVYIKIKGGKCMEEKTKRPHLCTDAHAPIIPHIIPFRQVEILLYRSTTDRSRPHGRVRLPSPTHRASYNNRQAVYTSSIHINVTDQSMKEETKNAKVLQTTYQSEPNFYTSVGNPLNGGSAGLGSHA